MYEVRYYSSKKNAELKNLNFTLVTRVHQASLAYGIRKKMLKEQPSQYKADLLIVVKT